MGNENSKSKGATKNGKTPEKHENGSFNGVAVNVTSNGLEIDVNGETVIHKNGGPPSLNLSTESTEPDFVVVESNGVHVNAPVVSEMLEAAVQEEEVKKSKEEKVSKGFGKLFKKKAAPPVEVQVTVEEKETPNEDQTDVSPPATDPEPESGSSGDEAAAMIVAEHGMDLKNPHQKAETSTQTDRKKEADISTQTGEDDDATTRTEGPVEEVVVMEAAATDEDSLDESAVVIAEEVVEETAFEEPLDSQTAGIISEEVVKMKTSMYENMVFRAQLVEVSDTFEINHITTYNPEEESVREPETETVAEPQRNPNKSITEDEIVAEENNVEETVPLEICFSLPKVVADCVEAVFAAVPESTEFAAGNTLIETAEPECNDVTPEAAEANDVPSPDEEQVTMMEAILEVVCEETWPTSANQDMPGEELSAPLTTEIQVEVESGPEEVTGDDAVAVEEVPGISEEIIIVCTPSNELLTIEEHPEDALNSPDDEVKPESIPENITTEESAEVGDVIADAGPEMIDVNDVEVMLEAAIDALCQAFELGITAPEPAVDNDIFVEEEVIAATTFVPLSGEREASPIIPEEPVETAAVEMSEEAIDILSNELDAVPESVEKDATETHKQTPVISEEPVEQNPSPPEENATTELLGDILESVVEAISEKLELTDGIVEEPADEQADLPPIDTTGESESCVSVQEDLIEENITPSEVMSEGIDEDTTASCMVAVEEPTDSDPVISEEPVEESVDPVERKKLVVILETAEEVTVEVTENVPEDVTAEVTKEMSHETDHSSDCLAPIVENAEDAQIAASDESVAECVEAVLETIVEEIIAEDLAAECSLVISEEEAPEIMADAEEKAEDESSVNSADSAQSAEETANLKQEPESLTEPESVTQDASPEEEKAPETENGNIQTEENQEDGNAEENPVMNFFKTLMTPTKTTKKETATPDAAKDQSQKESQPAATTTVAQVSEPPAAPKGMSIPPPPPPEPPKMEIKAEPAAKPVKPAPKEEPKAAAKEADSSKGKSAKDTLSKLFRPKALLGFKASKGKGASASGANAAAKTAAVTIKVTPQPAVEVEVQPVVEETPVEVPEPVVEVQSETNVEPEKAEEVAQQGVEEQTAEEVPQQVVEDEKVDPSKTGTLEAAPKPEPPPPAQEEKKPASKSSFLSFFKPKAADPKKATPAPAAAAADAAQAAKAKEEPKAAAKSSEAAVENKPASVASQAGDDAASAPKKLEKRNSVQLLFKFLGKRNSTDAGVQTEPVTVAAAAEKAK